MVHTPGPWELVDASMALDCDGFIATDTDKTIEIRPAVGVKLGDEKADFSLMAAAPELLAALVDAKSLIEALGVTHGDTMRGIRMAILKARRLV